MMNAYVINLHEFELIGTHWIALYVMVILWYILIALQLNIFQKNFRKNHRKQNLITNIYRIQA